MANGIPVVQPRRGAFPEILETTGGGLIVDADDDEALAEGLLTIWRDPDRAAALGAGRRCRRARALQRRTGWRRIAEAVYCSLMARTP